MAGCAREAPAASELGRQSDTFSGGRNRTRRTDDGCPEAVKSGRGKVADVREWPDESKQHEAFGPGKNHEIGFVRGCELRLVLFDGNRDRRSEDCVPGVAD